jgi:predicted SAM-dependent methyltransferase
MSTKVIPSKLNFGCGYDQREGYYNVDSDPACKPDLLLVDNDLSAIPRNHFDEVLARDVLEHIPRPQALAVILEWVDMLRMGGVLKVQTSSIEGVAERLSALPSFADHYAWTLCLFGNQAHPGDFHSNGFTERSLQVHLLAAGLQIDGMWLEEHWLLSAQGTKTSSWTDMLDGTDRMPIKEFVAHAFHAALGREPDELGGTHLRHELKRGRLTRREALKMLMSSPERLFNTATAYGL